MSEHVETGTIKKFLDVKSGISKTTNNEWKKQSFVISNNGGYEGKEQLFCFEVFGAEKVDNLTKFHNVGDEVTVKFNISTNEWQGKYFTSLGAWRIEKLNGEQNASDFQQAPSLSANEPTDLPF